MSLTSSIQKIISLLYGIEYRKLVKSFNQIEDVQRSNLNDIINYLMPYNKKLNSVNSYEEFASQFPVTQYSNWKNEIEEIRLNSTHPFRKICSRFEPTSGSTNAVKWIPYSKGFLAELNRAASAWLYDTFNQYPDVLKGKHYWSLSWVPPELQDTHNSNDVELFPFWQRSFLSKIMAVPDEVKSAKTQEACWFASLVYLVSTKDLTLMSLWSPTFLLQMITDIIKYKTEISSTLNNGKWSLFTEELTNVKCPRSAAQGDVLQMYGSGSKNELVKHLWPHLALISCWDSSTAEVWIPELKKIFSHVPLQGKGLWATEGIVTFPFQGKRVLAIRSHFYEFRCLETQRILPPWQLKENMFVQPIITSKNGMLRYELPDKMQVSGFINQTPCLNFINRINSVDLVGEKIDFNLAQGIIQEINQHFGVRGLCLIAEKRSMPKPKYKLLIEGELALKNENREMIEEFIESKLCNHYHYKLSRNLGQLGPCEVLAVSDSLPVLKGFQKSSIGGNNKIEPIVIAE